MTQRTSHSQHQHDRHGHPDMTPRPTEFTHARLLDLLTELYPGVQLAPRSSSPGRQRVVMLTLNAPPPTDESPPSPVAALLRPAHQDHPPMPAKTRTTTIAAPVRRV